MDTQSLAPRIREILEQADLSTVSAKKVRRQLELEISESLDTYKLEVDEIIKQQFQQLHNELQQRQQAQQQYAQQYSQDGTYGMSQSIVGVNIPGSKNDNVSGLVSNKSGVLDTTAPRKRGRPRKPENEKKQKRKKRLLDPDRPKRITGLTKPMKLSETLRDFLNRKYCARTDVVKELWKYIKAQQLQDPENRRYILCDDKLKLLFETDRMSMCEMNKLLNVHLVKPTPEENLEATALLDLSSNNLVDTPDLRPSDSKNPSASQLSNDTTPVRALSPKSPINDTGVLSFDDSSQTGDKSDNGTNNMLSPYPSIHSLHLPVPQSSQQPATTKLLSSFHLPGNNDSNNL
ncbi:SWIB-domain-containing protein [Coemansia reversa NRRL 1564]|uniref:SWIB-domain-containing protein n=1 Tax=Coemansia reversa (strain ATCC 12441 / NRRL 1564) TaxID=763665 RepID=A0A2G5B257_COERN|nr:SWIB-domain-containing protein [Coemansia reversa NRRL 1564]|eukprot:PIA12797.1 SWIB-domain-containing protein [Coemansia reversa NRRL 1564]